MLSDLEELPAVKFGENVLRFELDPLAQHAKDIATAELRETPEIKSKAVEDLKQLLKGIFYNMTGNKYNLVTHHFRIVYLCIVTMH